MLETDRMIERVKLNIMLTDFSLDEQKIIQQDIDEIKTILKSESLSLETITLLLYFYKNYKRK
jgi:hypothetical protein